MHELSIATALYRQCRGEVDRLGGGRLEAVEVAIGELSAIEPSLLRFAWEAVTSESDDVGAELDVDWREVKHLCRTCGDAGSVEASGWPRTCCECGSILAMQGGRELDVIALKYSSNEPESGATAQVGTSASDPD